MTYDVSVNGATYNGVPAVNLPKSGGGTATFFASGVYYGECESTSTSTKFTATIEGISEYYDGLTILLKNGVVTSASNFTININGLGALPSYNNMTVGNSVTPTNPTRDTTIFNINYAMFIIYSSTIVSGGGWIMYRGYDANTNTLGYQLRTNSTVLPTTHRTRYYRLLFTSADNKKWVPSNTGYDNSATSLKTVNQEPINPFGPIVYLGNSTNYNANADIAAASIWQQYTLTFGYSFNWTGAALTLTTKTPVYVKCAPQSDGSAIIDSTTPIVQTLPSTADGKIYIYLGIAYSATNIELQMVHPIYYYADGAIRLWTNPQTVTVPTNVSAFNNDAGYLTSSTGVTSFNGSSGAVTYTAPVTSVNGQTGAVTLSIPTVPTNVSSFNNDAGYLTLATLPIYNGGVS